MKKNDLDKKHLSVRLHILISEEMKNDLETLAAEKGLLLSSFVRMSLQELIKKGKKNDQDEQ